MSRQAFEAWCETILKDNPNWRESGDAELGWQAWQAATNAALERAAEVCETGLNGGGRRGWNQCVNWCANAIRALKDEK